MKRLLPAGITAGTLKYLAAASMLADHLAVVLVTGGLWHGALRTFGRLAFPIFAYLLTEGFIHTHSFGRYAARLALFALLSEVPFDLAIFGSWFYPGYQNVIFTLLTGLLVIEGMRRTQGSGWSRWLVVLAGCAVSWAFCTDYSAEGVLLVAIFYEYRQERDKGLALGALLSGAGSLKYCGASALAYIPLLAYNSRQGRWRFRFLFYLFYPAHLLVLYLARLALYG